MSGESFRDARPRFLTIVACVGAVTTIACVVAFLFFAASLDRREVVPAPSADGIVVLTGGADRIGDALHLLEAGRGRRLFISGVSVQTTKDTLKRRFAAQERLFDCCVDLDYQARNTFENARESRRWMLENDFRSMLLVTASYHLPRATLELESAIPGVVIHPVPVIPDSSKINRWWQEPVLARIILFEFAKYSAAILRVTLGLPGA